VKSRRIIICETLSDMCVFKWENREAEIYNLPTEVQTEKLNLDQPFSNIYVSHIINIRNKRSINEGGVNEPKSNVTS
jgi:hypothetical protein